MSGTDVKSLLESFLTTTESLYEAIKAEDNGEMEKLIETRAGIISEINSSNISKTGEHRELMEKIKKADKKNTEVIEDLMSGYKQEVRRLKLSRKSVRLYTGTNLPPDAGYFDKKS